MAGRLMERFTLFMFYPAVATHEMYCDIQILDDNGTEAKRLRCTEPVRFEAEINSIPPLSVTFKTIQDVDFFDISNNEIAFKLRKDSPGKVDFAPGFEITLKNPVVDLERKFFTRIIALRSLESGVKTISFLTGAFGAFPTSPPQAVDIEFELDIDIPVSATFQDIESRAGLIFQYFTSVGNPIEEYKVMVFKDLRSRW